MINSVSVMTEYFTFESTNPIFNLYNDKKEKVMCVIFHVPVKCAGMT